MVATAAAKTVSHARALALYEAVMDKIRLRHSPAPDSSMRAETWELATVHVLMGLTDDQAAIVLAYLRHLGGMAMPDVVLANTVAKRLGQTIEWQRKELLECLG